ncbi:MAG: DUF4214 domain-containing protein [Huintestinicola sp.]|uniref:DUF4214 domain-containing protein n=1 Tax=Huintestinicola sp. TaxID=2981661 RepID=UPI003F06689A
MKKRIVSLLLAVLMCMSMPCVSAAAEETASAQVAASQDLAQSTAVSAPDEDYTTSFRREYPELTVADVQQMDITECIEMANLIQPPQDTDRRIPSFRLSEVEEAVLDRVLGYDEANTDNTAVYSKDAAYNFTSSYYYDQLTAYEKKTYNEMLDACNTCLNSTSTYSSACFDSVTNYASRTYAEVDHLNQMFYYSNPQFFFYHGYAYSEDYSTLYLFVFDSCCSSSTRNTIKNSINNTTNSWLSTVNNISGPIAKEKWIAEKLCATITYTYDTYDQTLIGALYTNKCVCNGYAMAMNYLCNAAGIECVTIVSATHAWNCVKLYGTWYEVDVTWMDRDDAGNTCEYMWFNISRATAMSNEKTYYSSKVWGAHDPQTDLDAGSYFYMNIDYPYCTKDDPTDVVFNEANASAFVERLYVKLLGRASDPKGKANHVNSLRSGKSACEVAQKFVLSTELANKKLTNREFVKRMYLTMLDRSPDAAGLARWATALDNGCSYGYVLQGFGNSAEFTRLCASYGIVKGSYTSPENRDRNANLTAYVSRMYTKALGRKYDVRGLNSHTGKYLAGTSNAKDIAYAFIFSAEFKNKNLTDEQFVDTLYQALFDRKADAGGKSRWLTRMKNGYTREQVFNGFATSAEFKNMVAGFGI